MCVHDVLGGHVTVCLGFPAPTSAQLTTTCHSGSRGSEALFWLLMALIVTNNHVGKILFFKFQFPYVLSGGLQWYLLHPDVVGLNLGSTYETE